jgi:pimeloyl-ACP methyl ester carboxylesterase
LRTRTFLAVVAPVAAAALLGLVATRHPAPTVLAGDQPAPEEAARDDVPKKQPSRGGEGKYVTVYGARIHYIEQGTGPVVVLIHGLADDTSVWRDSMRPLARTYRTIAVDLIGHGRSAKPLFNYRPATFSDFFVGFLDALHIERATLVGNSLDGWVGLLVALRQPRRVERLVLVDSAGFADQEVPAVLNPSTLEECRDLLRYVFVSPRLVDDPALAAEVLTKRVENGDSYTIATFLASARRNKDSIDGQLGSLTVPALIVWGEQDHLIPLPVGRRFARDIRGSGLKIIPKCGHVPPFECPDAFNEALLNFLSKPKPKQPPR